MTIKSKLSSTPYVTSNNVTSSFSFLNLQNSSFLFGALCVIGIYVFFLVFAYLQEHIYRIGDKSKNDVFVYSIFLVFIICLFNTILSFLCIISKNGFNVKGTFNQLDNYALKEMIIISFTYVFAMLCTNYALTHVSYPTQVLVKSAKMLVVVIGGFLFFGKTYPWYDYLSVVVITSSLVLFNMAKMKTVDEVHQTAVGLILLFVALMCDGMTGPRQDRLLSKYNFSSISMMFFTNFFSLFWCIIASGIFERFGPLEFCYRYPTTIYYLVICAFSAALGQFFIFLSLKSFGSLYTSLITTLRKASSTLLSVYFFGHHLTYMQWVSVIAIFSSLVVQTYCSHKNKATKVTKKSDIYGNINDYIVQKENQAYCIKQQ